MWHESGDPDACGRVVRTRMHFRRRRIGSTAAPIRMHGDPRSQFEMMTGSGRAFLTLGLRPSLALPRQSWLGRHPPQHAAAPGEVAPQRGQRAWLATNRGRLTLRTSMNSPPSRSRPPERGRRHPIVGSTTRWSRQRAVPHVPGAPASDPGCRGPRSTELGVLAVGR